MHDDPIVQKMNAPPLVGRSLCLLVAAPPNPFEQPPCGAGCAFLRNAKLDRGTTAADAIVIRCARPVLVYFIFFFRGPLGLEVGLRSTPFRKWVRSNLSKKTNNPNPSPIGKRFGLYGRGAGGRTRTGTDFSAAF